MSQVSDRAGAGMRLVAAVLLAAALAAGRAAAQEVRAGTTKTLPAVSVALQAGATGREERRAVYAPPPGWRILSHRVECTAKYGLASYAVSTVPGDWHWSSDRQSAQGRAARAAAAVQAPGAGGQAGGTTESSTTAADHGSASASHHALVVEAAAQGAGLFRGGAGIELTVYVELVYVGGADAAPAGGR